MNLLVSYNWLKEYLQTKDSPETFARRVSLCGPAVERSYPQAPLFDHIVVGQIKAVRQHPSADKLHLALTDIGERELEFVCGGSNLAVGMKVVVALVGAKVRWHGQGDLIELQPAEIRGVKSEGMICGASEIGLDAAFPHAEREILDLSWCKSRPGTALAKALGLEDTVFDIEVTSNRPDAFSMVGLAREAAAILGDKFSWKEAVVPSVTKTTKALPLTVQNESPELCPRYQAVVMDGIVVGPSPWWLKNRLRLAGIRPINNVVDITNYVMLEHGQPMHAFDYDQLRGATVVVREARKGEKLKLLDERTVGVGPGNLLIADAERALAVAGVMGGEDSGVSAATKTIVFESACFDPVSVRRTARAVNAQTDASLRFEKGLPEEQTSAALARAVELCQEIAGGRVASSVQDSWPAPRKRAKFPFRPQQAEALIGVKLPTAQMLKILKALGFGISCRLGSVKSSRYEVTVPYWRQRDIEDERDFAEEIARVYGYHNLPSVIPSGEIPVEAPDVTLTVQDQSKRFLASVGFTELVNYSFVSREAVIKCGFAAEAALAVANPLSADFEVMRPSLWPGCLAVIADNQGEFPEARVFEVSNVYHPASGAALPEERLMLLAAAYGPAKSAETRLREIRGTFEVYAERFGLRGWELRRLEDSPQWHPGRSAAIWCGDRHIGVIGEVHPSVAAKFGLDGRVTALELDLAAVLAVAEPGARYVEPSPFPPVRRDLAFVLDESVAYDDLTRELRAASELIRAVELFDIYRGPTLGEGKRSLALHLTLARDDRTLTADEAETALTAAKAAVADKFGASLRG